MTLQEALEESPKCDGLPIISKCMYAAINQDCEHFLDEKSRIIAETRGKVEVIFSHGICQTCFEKL